MCFVALCQRMVVLKAAPFKLQSLYSYTNGPNLVYKADKLGSYLVHLNDILNLKWSKYGDNEVEIAYPVVRYSMDWLPSMRPTFSKRTGNLATFFRSPDIERRLDCHNTWRWIHSVCAWPWVVSSSHFQRPCWILAIRWVRAWRQDH